MPPDFSALVFIVVIVIIISSSGSGEGVDELLLHGYSRWRFW
ncbi:MAG: hypothetical protein ACOY3L_03965 [Pseudomonadota bacterium]